VLALADHDSVESVAEATEAAAGTPLTIVPAVELSAVSEHVDVHVLAYFVDPFDEGLAAQLVDLRAARRRRAVAMVEALTAAGHLVSLDDVLACSEGGAVGRSHIARALVASGAAESVPDAFQRLIGRHRPFYVPKVSSSPEEVVVHIRALGALPVLAHPGVTHVDHLIPALVDAGLAGIEAYHADHTPEQRERYAALAMSLGVLATGGSDFHGIAVHAAELGSVDIPAEAIDAFLAADPRA
jgi:predicted metal-dependent phosphoesterase TrpH